MFNNLINIKFFQLIRENWNIFLFFFLILILFFKNYDYVNNDGILYIAQSKMILNGEFLRAYELHKNIYSFIAALISYLLSISVLSSFKLLNLIFILLGYLFFSLITKKILYSRQNREILCYQAFVLSLLNFQYFNTYIFYIIRDHAAWCFFFISFYFFIENKPLRSYFFIFIAGIFRIEYIFFGLIYLFLKILKRKNVLQSKKIFSLIALASIFLFIALYNVNYSTIEYNNSFSILFLYPFSKYTFSFLIYNLFTIITAFAICKKFFVINEYLYILGSIFFLAFVNYYIQGTISYRYIQLSYLVFILYIFSIGSKSEKN